MHTENLPAWHHEHVYGPGTRAAERGTRAVMWITLVMMAVEILTGWWFNSMALLADGWHMSSHALAIGLSAFAYAAARRHARDPRFAFGTWKIEVLGGFASAILLLGVAVLMVAGSVERLLRPQPIAYQEAVVVAVLGLLVNVLCALILMRAHHDHSHSGQSLQVHAHQDHVRHDRAHPGQAPHEHAHPDHGRHDHSPLADAPRHHDINLRSAYLHVLADAATSVMAIVALLGGWFYGWAWLDPVMGCLGAVLVAMWAKNLLTESGRVLLDREMDHPVVAEIRAAVETGPEAGDTRVTDLHVWRVGGSVFSCVMTVVTHDHALTADRVRERLAVHPEVVHATVEVQFCVDA